MLVEDDDLVAFERVGPPALPRAGRSDWIETEGARIWWALHGADGPCVTLLHGGSGNSGNWGYQLEPLIEAGYRVLLVDSRGHGRSTRDDQPYSYRLMSRDVLAILDHIGVDRTAIVGWSDGACTGLELCIAHPARIAGLFFFACNVDSTGVKPFEFTPQIGRCLSRHQQDYAALSATPGDFDAFSDAVRAMQESQPDLGASDLAAIGSDIVVVQAEGDEFITAEHAEYLARTLGNARLVLLPGVTHFAPVQRPHVFNAAVLDYLATLDFG